MGACPGSTFPLRDVQYSLTRNSFEMFRPWFLRNSYKSEKQSVKRQTPRHSVFVCLSVIRNTLLYPSQKRMINPGCYRFPDGGLHPRRSRLWSVRLGSLHVKTSVEHHGDLDNLFQCVCVCARALLGQVSSETTSAGIKRLWMNAMRSLSVFHLFISV